MISRVKTPQGTPELRTKAIPPGAPVAIPVQIVFITHDGTVATVPADSLITADGAPVYATRPGSWGQLRAAGRP